LTHRIISPQALDPSVDVEIGMKTSATASLGTL